MVQCVQVVKVESPTAIQRVIAPMSLGNKNTPDSQISVRSFEE